MALLTWQVKDTQGERIAAFAHSEDAARFVGGLDGYRVAYGGRHSDIWEEGHECMSAAESFDEAGRIMRERAEAQAMGRAFVAIRRALA